VTHTLPYALSAAFDPTGKAGFPRTHQLRLLGPLVHKAVRLYWVGWPKRLQHGTVPDVNSATTGKGSRERVQARMEFMSVLAAFAEHFPLEVAEEMRPYFGRTPQAQFNLWYQVILAPIIRDTAKLAPEAHDGPLPAVITFQDPTVYERRMMQAEGLYVASKAWLENLQEAAA
jgi:hypothetical protein